MPVLKYGMMINLQELREAIRSMKYRHPLYRLLKDELTLLGNWKNKTRGDASKGGRARKAQQEREG